MHVPNPRETNVELDKPSCARMYDYWLGGSHNFAIDRLAAEQVLAAIPNMRSIIQVNRAFLRRAVRFLSEQGVDQFLDLGSGLPTVGNVHEVAQAIHPESRVVYVDIDPVVVSYGRQLLKYNQLATALHGDLREPDSLLRNSAIRGLLDFNRPVALLYCSVLHFVLDDKTAEHVVNRIGAALSSGSYLVVTHASYDHVPAEVRAQVEQSSVASGTPLHVRSPAEIMRYFATFELVDPGLVYIPLWRPETPDDLLLDAPEQSCGYAGVGRKP
jgi:S-adenosyl methyltransferase